MLEMKDYVELIQKIKSIALIESNLLPQTSHNCCANSLSNCGHTNADMSRVCLHFRKTSLETQYQLSRLSHFSLNINSVSGVFLVLAAIQLTLTPITWTSLSLLSSVALILVTLVVTINLQKVLSSEDRITADQSLHRDLEDGRDSSSSCCQWISLANNPLNSTNAARIVCSIVAAVFIVCENCLSLALIDCADIPVDVSANSSRSSRADCLLLLSHFRLVSPLVVLIAISFFFFLGFLLKTLLMLCYLSAVLAIHWSATTDPPTNRNAVLLCLFSVALILCFLFRDRHMELTSRSHFLWTANLRVEQNDVEVMGGINKILLENILPQHVASHFLLSKSCLSADSLYHERYSSVAVMFASIPNYKEFYDENDVNKQGLECLRLLNEIICDFDKLILKPKFSCIEKIKTIGSTYMAAAGLQPGQESPNDSTHTQSDGQHGRNGTQRAEHHIIALVELAVALNNTLQQINRESFQRFRLRVGINHGPVIAGVVGAHKPQYDIWGNTVNVASRMDSTGAMGRIHVTKDTADVLLRNGYEVEARGRIFVKGKGELETYFVVCAHLKSDC